jgi:hypothetical protein
VGHKVNGLGAEKAGKLINAPGQGKGAYPDSRYNYPGKKMREIGYNLYVFFKGGKTNFIESYRKDHKGGKKQYVFHKADNKGIAQYLGKGGAGKYKVEITQPRENPGASGTKLIKGKTHIENWYDPENDKKQQGWK